MAGNLLLKEYVYMVIGKLIADSDDWVEEVEFEFVMEQLTKLMKKKQYGRRDGGVYWKVSGENMGWQKRSGYKYLEASEGAELVAAILPTKECRYQIYKEATGFCLIVYHHDSPTGETYWVRPCSEGTYNRFMEGHNV